MPENQNPENHVPAEQAAPKRQLRNPFAKNSSTNEVDTETPKRKLKVPSSVYTVGTLLVVAGVVAAVVTKVTSPSENEVDEVESSDETAA